MEVVFDGSVVIRPYAGVVDVFEAEQEAAAVLTSQIVGDLGRVGVAEVQPAGRARGETGDGLGHRRGFRLGAGAE